MKKLGMLILVLILLVGSYATSEQLSSGLPTTITESVIDEVANLKLQLTSAEKEKQALKNELARLKKANIRPLNQHLTSTRRDWIDAYGDTLETQIVYNLTLLRQNDVVIAKAINRMQLPVDPNASTLEARVEALENKIESLPKIIKFDENGNIIDEAIKDLRTDPNETK